jgi:hypothetical protein
VCSYAEFGGFHGVIAALLVAVRQLSPEEPLIDYGPARLRLRAKVCARAASATLPLSATPHVALLAAVAALHCASTALAV